MDGSCLCGEVRWRARAPFPFVSHCHCSRCRHIFVAAKAGWDEITDGLPQHAELPPA